LWRDGNRVIGKAMMIVFLFLFQLLLFAIGIFGPWRDAPARQTNGRLPLAARMLLSASLLVAACVIWQSGAKPAAYAQWVMFGMLASFIGDLIMARLIPLPNRLIGGMLAFGIAHALYITAYVQTMGSLRVAATSSGLWFGLAFYGVFTVFGWLALIRNPQKGTAINLGALGYGLWISAMASFALALGYLFDGVFWLTALGGLLFVASDFIIGVTDIRGVAIENANDWIWLTYVLGQMGIIYAGWLA
jgi:hypothetical protein